MIRATLVGIVFCLLPWKSMAALEATIPKPEHPRPDAMRELWVNLNGAWEFRFDAAGKGLEAGWEKPGTKGFDRMIVVPFPWESELSGIHQAKGAPKIGWYRRRFTIPKTFPNEQKVWLRFGAVELAGRCLGQWSEGRGARGGIHPVRDRHFRRHRPCRRECPGRSRVRSD